MYLCLFVLDKWNVVPKSYRCVVVLTFQTETASSSKTSVHVCQTTCHLSYDSNLHSHRNENIKYHKQLMISVCGLKYAPLRTYLL
jgi:hypothetical protein